jgi:hypothetical protein
MGEFKAYDLNMDHRPFYLAMSLGLRALFPSGILRFFKTMIFVGEERNYH